MKRVIVVCAVVVLFCSGYAGAATWTSVAYPGAPHTLVTGIDGSNLAGSYYDASEKRHGFSYDGTTWASFDAPGTIYTQDIDGSNIVGYYYDTSGNGHGFLYNGTSLTTYDAPGATETYIYGIEGSNLVGYSRFGNAYHGVIYNGTTWTTIDKPGSNLAIIDGIKGSNLFGSYYDNSWNKHGFLYDGTNWTTLEPFGIQSWITGIDGSHIVGYLEYEYNFHGLVFDGTDWILYDMPGASDTYIMDIDAGKAVGFYYDAFDGRARGFVCEIPEPATFLLLCLGGVLLRRCSRCEGR